MIQKALNFLHNNLEEINDAYTISVVCYALHLMKSSNASDLLSRFHIPLRADDEGKDWQNSQSSSVPSPFDWLYEKSKRTTTDDEQLNITRSKNTTYTYIKKLHYG